MTSPSPRIPMKLDLTHMQQLQVSKVFQDNTKEITSLDFDDDGKYCITGSADDSIHLYDCIMGKSQKLLFSKKYGAHPIRFTHSSSTIIHGSNKRDNMIRYLSISENRYISYFKGHEGRVTSMAMSPVDDFFISAAIEDSLLLWDLGSNHPQGRVRLGRGRPSVAFDPSGMVFASAIQQDNKVRLYDLRNFDKGPFAQFVILDPYLSALSYPRPGIAMPIWTSIKFSNDDKYILISTGGDQHYIIDAYSGDLKRRLIGHVGLADVATGAGGDDTCFTPNGAFVVSGSQDGSISIWDINASTPIQNDLRPIKQLEAHTKPTQVVQFNPRYMCMVSGCHELAFWEPTLPGLSNSSGDGGNSSNQEMLRLNTHPGNSGNNGDRYVPNAETMYDLVYLFFADAIIKDKIYVFNWEETPFLSQSSLNMGTRHRCLIYKRELLFTLIISIKNFVTQRLIYVYHQPHNVMAQSDSNENVTSTTSSLSFSDPHFKCDLLADNAREYVMTTDQPLLSWFDLGGALILTCLLTLLEQTKISCGIIITLLIIWVWSKCNIIKEGDFPGFDGLQLVTAGEKHLSVKTSYMDGRCVSRFIDRSKILDVIINEGITMLQVKFYLAIIVESQDRMVVVFEHLLPRLNVLLEVYQGTRAVLFNENEETFDSNDKYEPPTQIPSQLPNLLTEINLSLVNDALALKYLLIESLAAAQKQWLKTAVWRSVTYKPHEFRSSDPDIKKQTKRQTNYVNRFDKMERTIIYVDHKAGVKRNIHMVKE
ncbi:hypothetical protein G9A89_014962 [Geosiphon pyriformis]|nr:hypothetical protein G9A89_014962 [Geosiphon pyriformis]